MNEQDNKTIGQQVAATVAGLMQSLTAAGCIPARTQQQAAPLPAPLPLSSAPSAFDRQVRDIRQGEINKTTDNAADGKAAMQAGRGAAVSKQANMVETARRLARELAANGPITIDAVSRKLREEGYEKTADIDPENRRFWKGGVFATGEWVCISFDPSRVAANHARIVRMWALKTWLQKNPLNGCNFLVSAFHIRGIFEEFRRANPGVRPQDCNWKIGAARLAGQCMSEIKAGGMTLYGVPVTLVPEAVGALIELPPSLPQGMRA